MSVLCELTRKTDKEPPRDILLGAVLKEGGVRSLGIPARIAAGFRLGTVQDDGRYLVYATDVHVWVKVRFAGYGWLPFAEHGATHPYARPGTYLNPMG
jgi:hypothetical protein